MSSMWTPFTFVVSCDSFILEHTREQMEVAIAALKSTVVRITGRLAYPNS